MSWSYRKRGYEARTHKKAVARRDALNIRFIVVSSGIVGMCDAPRNSVIDSVFIRRMLVYSAR